MNFTSMTIALLSSLTMIFLILNLNMAYRVEGIETGRYKVGAVRVGNAFSHCWVVEVDDTSREDRADSKFFLSCGK